MDDPKEWSRWRLIGAENFNVSYSEAMAMDDFEVGVANAALDKLIKLRDKAMKKGKKKGGRR